MSPDFPIILLSGMGADERMFAKLRPLLPEVVVPEWIRPEPRETLREYARRMAAHVDPGRPCVVGGASFGGFLALEMLPYLRNAQACVLIGAVRSPAEFPPWIRWLKPVVPLLRVMPFQLFWWASGLIAAVIGPVLPRRMREFLWLGSSLDPVFFRWAAAAVLTWGDDGPPPTPRVPVYHVQGARDRVLPAKRTTPTELVPRGGHVIALSNPRDVAGFIRRHLSPELAPAAATA
ncbi:MAG TPA: alpha/beta hydrolase [Humisphaera sp.]